MGQAVAAIVEAATGLELVGTWHRDEALEPLVRTADVLIDFMVYTEQRIETRQTPASTVPYPHRGTTTWPSYDTKVHQHSEGSMHIDLIDPGTGHLVVEGSAQSWVGDEEFTQQHLTKAQRPDQQSIGHRQLSQIGIPDEILERDPPPQHVLTHAIRPR